jgi:hypothetical protein
MQHPILTAHAGGRGADDETAWGAIAEAVDAALTRLDVSSTCRRDLIRLRTACLLCAGLPPLLQLQQAMMG